MAIEKFDPDVVVTIFGVTIDPINQTVTEKGVTRPFGPKEFEFFGVKDSAEMSVLVAARRTEILDEKQKTDAANLAQQNKKTLLQNAANALQSNATLLANGSPSNAQVLAQVRAMTRQMNALIRITTESLQDISDT